MQFYIGFLKQTLTEHNIAVSAIVQLSSLQILLAFYAIVDLSYFQSGGQLCASLH